MKVIFGSSGQAKELYLIIRRIFGVRASVDYFVCSDDDPNIGRSIVGVPIVRESVFFEMNKSADVEVYIGIGSPSLREKIYRKISDWNQRAIFPSLIDPNAFVDLDVGNVVIGQGVLICAGAAITTDIVIESFVHINQNCTIGHDSHIGEFSTLSPAVNISGNVKTGARVFLGVGAVVIEGLCIYADAVVGAGAVLLSDINEPGVYVGVPARLKVQK